VYIAAFNNKLAGERLMPTQQTNDQPTAKVDEQQIRLLHATWLAATRAGDVATVMSLMTEDVVFLLPGREPMRREEFHAQSLAQISAAAPIIDGTGEIQEIKIAGDWAFMWTKLSITITPPDKGEVMVRAGHTLTILQRVNGRWLLARDANLLTAVKSRHG
jgi:uncharacterized protein (TIGR02246 family)